MDWFDEIIKDYNLNSDYINTPKVIITDCDGILNDGKFYYDENGKRFKAFGCHDKEMVKFFVEQLGWKIIFVSRDSTGFEITKKRLTDTFNFLGNNLILYNYDDKQRVDLVNRYSSIGYFTVFCGDSLSDIPALKASDYPATTNNAFGPVKDYCKYISGLNGGEGGFADILLNIIYNKLLN